MSATAIATIVFGGLILGTAIMFILERRAVAKRREARGGREIDVSDLILFGSAAGEGKKTND